ncbi:hypothetical protein ACI6PS_03460 [Flavobacterium sp. PLA-1-15]|uniref:hypothetical protein n=1 Tax=Flavobacterium sp. PLA-1-15 TaxID=3380533 RepID=UPI003B7F1020
MQEKLPKFEFIKERVMYFIDNQRFKKVDFFNKIDVTSANFRGNQIKSSLSSTTIERIITNYPQLNLHWLITGKGKMLLSKEEINYTVDENQLGVVNEPTNNDDIIEVLKDQVAELKKDKIELIKDKEKLYSLLETKMGKQNAS